MGLNRSEKRYGLGCHPERPQTFNFNTEDKHIKSVIACQVSLIYWWGKRDDAMHGLEVS